MTTQDLLHILEDLGEEDFSYFKWFLQQPGNLEGFPAIKRRKLENTKRCDTVDVMVQTYRLPGAVEVTRKVLGKISRNDLVQHLSVSSSEPAGSDPSGQPRQQPRQQPQSNTSQEEDPLSVRRGFINGVSDIGALLDKLLEEEVINYGEMESIKAKPTRKEKAEELFDMVQRKGDKAYGILKHGLRETDQYFYETLYRAK